MPKTDRFVLANDYLNKLQIYIHYIVLTSNNHALVDSSIISISSSEQ